MTTPSFSRFLTLALVLLVQTVDVSAQGQACHICGGNGNNDMQFPNVVLDGVGKTCSALSIEVASANALGSAGCTNAQNTWRSRCCTGQRPTGTNLADMPLPPQNIPTVAKTGPFPVCNTCRDGDFPYATSMVINFLYIGVGDCVQYWRMGKQGLIEPNMCQPVQFFSYEPCGCGEFNPYFNRNHPANQQAQQAPQQNTNTNPNRTNGGGSTPSSTAAQQKDPNSANAGKEGQSLGQSYGGSGGLYHGGRKLKGSKATSSNPAEDVVMSV